ncbi:hypothetical protein TWF481_000676 [Arthrobotrys musiformis]|uniref:Laccase n=1 Tax=Arthrobotrys musiformis TaxID=47236 RepID=A0AAV9WU10_9PEZI
MQLRGFLQTLAVGSISISLGGSPNVNAHPTASDLDASVNIAPTARKSNCKGPIGIPKPYVSNYDRSSTCCHSPIHRECWDGKHNLWTDYEDLEKVPKGVVRKYELVITNGEIAPDGYTVQKMLVNGQYPGPKIEGNWGDTFEITVKNRLSNGNGTSIHFHGIQQLGTNRMDGASGVTQCPIPVGKSMTYIWRANQYGTSWYHSHFSLQYTDGVVGPLVIHGPSSVNYDEEYTLMLSDWFHTSAFTLYYNEVNGIPPLPDSKLLNGKWKFPCNSTDPRCVSEKGGFSEIVFKKGRKYRLRLINMSTTYMQTFWIDGHDFMVAAADFVPIEPYRASVINVAIGQRYDIIVEANADTCVQTDFWINMKTCLIPPGQQPLECSPEDAKMGIVRYDAKSTKNPPIISNCGDQKACQEEPKELVRPIVKKSVPPPPSDLLEGLYVSWDFPYNTSEGTTEWRWNMGNSPLFIEWDEPTYSYLGLEGQQKPLPPSHQPIYLNEKDKWVYFVINANFTPNRPERHPIPLDHPIHLHGHDFVVLAQIPHDQYNKNAPIKYDLDNPMRRDTAVLPGGGFLVIAFETKNPGAWLIHCHLAFHSSAGFALQFIERESEILGQFSGKQVKFYNEQCQQWRKDWAINPARTGVKDSGA